MFNNRDICNVFALQELQTDIIVLVWTEDQLTSSSCRVLAFSHRFLSAAVPEIDR